jgi:hypothetical protein
MNLEGQYLCIMFYQQQAYLTVDTAIDIAQISLPPIAHNFPQVVYWQLKILKHQIDVGDIFCEVISYHIGETEFTASQLMLHDELINIKTIRFQRLDTAGVLRTCKLPPAIPALDDSPVFVSAQEARTQQQTYIAEIIKNVNIPSVIKPAPIEIIKTLWTIKDSFKVSLNDAKFTLGALTFSKKIKQINTIVDFTIYNEHLREEFEAVKHYFAKMLGGVRINVQVEIELEGYNTVLNTTARSQQVALINNELIESIRFEFVHNISKKKIAVDIDKSIFTMEEYLDAYNEKGGKANIFHASDTELFDDLLHISNTKHYKNLRYLSEQHAHTIMKLRFIHKPLSFIFLLEGTQQYHLIWETLDTQEATYIWRCNKDVQALKNTVQKIEQIINLIKVQGKIAYINSKEDSFQRIIHDYSDAQNGFLKWKSELEMWLV